MDIDKQEDLINSNKEPKELKELVDLHNLNDGDEIPNTEKEEIPEEVKQNLKKKEILEETELIIEKTKEEEEENLLKEKKKINYIDESGEPIGKKQLKSLLLILNSYWIELMGSISLIISLFIFAILITNFLMVINPTGDKTSMGHLLNLLESLVELGFKWFFFITMGNHLSVGFFSLATFTSILKDSKNIIKFYIVNFIKVGIYYALSIVILKLILKDVVNELFNIYIENINVTNKNVNEFFHRLVEKLGNYLGVFLSTYNIFLEKIVFGTMYIFLFKEPKNFVGKRLLYFRLLALIPLIFTILSIVFRALHNSYNKNNERYLEINIYILPLLLGSKISIYLFFISTLSFLKYKSLKNKIFDEENEIQPRLFAKIGSRIFGIIGVLELIIGLFLPSWSTVGIGGKYLFVLCSPVLALYDYKQEYTLKFPCCKKGNMSLCFKLVFLIIFYAIIIFFWFILILFVIMAIRNKMENISYFIIKYFDLVMSFLNILL